VLVRGAASTELTNVEISSNVCNGAGGGLHLGGTFSIADSQVFDNLADHGGGLVLVGAEGTIADSAIRENESIARGGGVYLEASTATFSTTSVVSNLSLVTGGGAWVFDGTLTVLSGDWGDGPDDNRPDDVVVGGTSYADFGAPSAFSCTSAGGECL
jgi:hypothetical protein